MVIQVPARVYYALSRLLRLFTLHCTRKRSVVKGEATQQTGRSVVLDLAGEVGETYLPGSHAHDHGLRAEFEAGSEPLPLINAEIPVLALRATLRRVSIARKRV